MTATDSTAAIETVFRLELPRLVGGLARYVGDVGLAEELAQDALLDALTQWPDRGTPRNPGAWLMAVAKRKAVDRFRRDRNLAAKYAQIGRAQVARDAEADGDGFDAAFEDRIDDDVVRLIFVACHPVLARPSRVALTLRLVCGLTTAEIARAFLQRESTVAQRIVRAKRTIAEAQVPFEVPPPPERPARLRAVLEVVYLVFNEGYSATAGDDWTRPALCAEALRLGRILAAMAPDEPEVHGLLALMEIQSSRLAARVGVDGQPVLLLDQDRRRWDRLSITRGLAHLERAGELGGAEGPYALQGAIAACHGVAVDAADTDWVRLAELYATLARVTPSPVVELNRAVAVAMAQGPEAGLELVDQLVAQGSLERYHLLHSVRGDLLGRLGRDQEAGQAFARAAELTDNESERALSQRRARAAASASVASPSVASVASSGPQLVAPRPAEPVSEPVDD